MIRSTKFHIGQNVKALADGQGLFKGLVYEVLAVHVTPTSFGKLVTYELVDELGSLIAVQNGHLILEEVGASS